MNKVNKGNSKKIKEVGPIYQLLDDFTLEVGGFEEARCTKRVDTQRGSRSWLVMVSRYSEMRSLDVLLLVMLLWGARARPLKHKPQKTLWTRGWKLCRAN